MNRSTSVIALLMAGAFAIGAGATAIFNDLSQHPEVPTVCLSALDDADDVIQTSIDVSRATTAYFRGGDSQTYQDALSRATDEVSGSHYDENANACRDAR
jgi:hypothetical protein